MRLFRSGLFRRVRLILVGLILARCCGSNRAQLFGKGRRFLRMVERARAARPKVCIPGIRAMRDRLGLVGFGQLAHSAVFGPGQPLGLRAARQFGASQFGKAAGAITVSSTLATRIGAGAPGSAGLLSAANWRSFSRYWPAVGAT
jgi:hypothetical protein